MNLNTKTELAFRQNICPECQLCFYMKDVKVQSTGDVWHVRSGMERNAKRTRRREETAVRAAVSAQGGCRR